MSKINTIIFDCFGVLYPTYTYNYFVRNKKKFAKNLELFDRLCKQIDLGQITQSEFYEAIASEIKIPATKIQTEMEAELVPDQTLIDVIKKLKTLYKIGLLSNAGEEEISIIHRDGLADLFDAIAVSYEVGDVKPNEKIYYTCLQRLDVAPAESIYFDDSIENVEAAKRLNMQAVHYPMYGNPPQQLVDLAKYCP